MTCYACWVRGRSNAATKFLRFEASNKLRPVCSDCLDDFLKRNLPERFTWIPFEEGFEEWTIQEVQST